MPEVAALAEASAWSRSFLEPMRTTASPASGQWAGTTQKGLVLFLENEFRARRKVGASRSMKLELGQQSTVDPDSRPVEMTAHEAALFQNRSQLKLMTSQIGMHLGLE